LFSRELTPNFRKQLRGEKGKNNEICTEKVLRTNLIP